MRRISNAPGSALVVVLVIVSMLFLICLSYSQGICSIAKDLEDSNASATALELAQCASSQRMGQLWQAVQALAATSSSTNSAISQLNLSSYNSGPNNWNSPQKYGPGYVLTQVAYYPYTAGTALPGTAPNFSTQQYVDVQLTTTAQIPRSGISQTSTYDWEYRTVQYVVRLNNTSKSSVFNFAYFVNNFAWFYTDSSGRVYGNVGSNGNCSVQNPVIDGYIYASVNPAINAAGQIIGAGGVSHDSFSQYQNGANLPSNLVHGLYPTNPPYGTISYPPGYTGNVSLYSAMSPLPMPYLGDLSQYMDEASAAGGTIQQLRFGGNPSNPSDWVTLINGAYGNLTGQNGMYATINGDGSISMNNISTQLSTTNQKANGNVALVGTAAQPLKITGPVVVTNDLMLKGTITGQGTVYTGRNLHIIGSITYKNPPSWTQKDSNFTNDLATNSTSDMVGFAVKGSTIIGDYYQMPQSGKSANGQFYSGGNYWSQVQSYFMTGFQNEQAQFYQTDPTDQAIGYYNPATGGFDGIYTNADGGLRYNNANNTATTARNFYESSFSYQYAQSIYSDVSTVQGIYYTNHLFGGRMDNFALYGSMVARDEGMIYSGYCYLFYDPRSYSNTCSTSSTVNIWQAQPPGYNVWLSQEASSAPFQKSFTSAGM